MRKAGRSEIGSKKVEPQTLEQRIEDFNQAVYKGIEAHSGENSPKDKTDISTSMRELDKLLHRHTAESETLSSADHVKFNNGTKEASEKLTELFIQLNTALKQLREKTAPSTAAQPPDQKQGINSPSSPENRSPLPQTPPASKKVVRSERTQSEKQEKSEKTTAVRQAFDDVTKILKSADELSSGEVSPRDMRNLNARMKDFQESPAYQQLEQSDKENIEKEFAYKIQAISEKRLSPHTSPKTSRQTEKGAQQATVSASISATAPPKGQSDTFAVGLKLDDFLMRANIINLQGGTETKIAELRNEYKVFIARDDFQALNASRQNDFIRSMVKLLPTITKEVSIPKEATVLLDRAQKLASAQSTPKEITRLLNDYHQFTQTADFKNANQSAKDQFVQSFENSIKAISKPNQTVATSQEPTATIQVQAATKSLPTIGTRRQQSKSTESAQAVTDQTVSADQTVSVAPKSKPLPKLPPAFQKAMEERKSRAEPITKEKVTPTRQSRSGSIKGGP